MIDIPYELGPSALYTDAGADTNGMPLPCEGISTVCVQLTGTLTTVVVYWEGTVDGTNWFGLLGWESTTGARALTATATGAYLVNVVGLFQFRARLDHTSGSVTATAKGSSVAFTGLPVSSSGLTVQGNVASGATDAGNPVKVGGKYNSTLPTLTNGQRGDLQQGSRGSLNVTLFSQDSASPVAAVNANADALNSAQGIVTTTQNLLYNSSTYDRGRNNHEATIFASAARSANTNSSDIVNYNARGVVITIDLTVLGSTSVTFTVTYKDSLSGKYVTLLASAALGVSTTSLVIYPGVTVAANLAVSTPLPRIFRVQAVRDGTPGTDTYSVSANYIN